jgi:hypothetical protein
VSDRRFGLVLLAFLVAYGWLCAFIGALWPWLPLLPFGG